MKEEYRNEWHSVNESLPNNITLIFYLIIGWDENSGYIGKAFKNPNGELRFYDTPTKNNVTHWTLVELPF